MTYFFDIHDEAGISVNPEGLAFDDPQIATKEAKKAIFEIVGLVPQVGKKSLSIEVWVGRVPRHRRCPRQRHRQAKLRRG